MGREKQFHFEEAFKNLVAFQFETNAQIFTFSTGPNWNFRASLPGRLYLNRETKRLEVPDSKNTYVAAGEVAQSS